ncbi:MAG: hypothetical protein FJ272_17615, partial [Planctomycetes bacterium]|nr:hypothetical protein [Planctomycetota bacterium]
MMKTPIYSLLLVLALAPLALALDSNDLGIIPSPKEIRLGRAAMPLVRDGKPVATIVLAGGPCRQAEIGADEINEQVESLCGVRLP